VPLGVPPRASAAVGAVVLVTQFAAGSPAGALITALLTCVVGALWFAVPLAQRRNRP